MKKNNFFAITLLAVIALVFVGCTGKKEASGGNVYNPKEHFTAVPVDIDFVENWMLPTDGVITEVELENSGLGIYRIRVQGITKAQCENYKKTLVSKGMIEGFDKLSNDKILIDFTNTYLRDKAEESVLTLRIYKR